MLPPSCCLQYKTYQSSRTHQLIRVFSCASKRLHFGALVYISISQNGPVLTEMCSPPSCCQQHKTYQCRTRRWSIRVFSCASKRLHCGVLVHISISKNGPVLTKIHSPLLVLATCQSSRTCQSTLGFCHTSKRIHLDILVC